MYIQFIDCQRQADNTAQKTNVQTLMASFMPRTYKDGKGDGSIYEEMDV